jgi:hypothetical protein
VGRGKLRNLLRRLVVDGNGKRWFGWLRSVAGYMDESRFGGDFVNVVIGLGFWSRKGHTCPAHFDTLQ